MKFASLMQILRSKDLINQFNAIAFPFLAIGMIGAFVYSAKPPHIHFSDINFPPQGYDYSKEDP